ncbi:MAG: hypothetical protein ACUVTZ_09485 [Armatimonadota bacterium]
MSKKCRYLSLSSIGSFGKSKRDLLPFNWRRENELVIAVDTSALRGDDRANLGRLAEEIFLNWQGLQPILMPISAPKPAA